VANSIWKHQFILKDIEDGASFLSIFYELIESGGINIIRYTKRMLAEAYALAGKHKLTVYDATFLVLALETGTQLKTVDARLLRIFNSEAG
jgi:predicted nucleic acid-binding protein